MDYAPHSATQVINQLSEQLSSDKRKLSFLFGAGTSMAVGVPGVTGITNKIEEKLTPPFKEIFKGIRKEFQFDNIEHILNKIRTIRELIGNTDREYDGIKGYKIGLQLDREICKAIIDIVETNKKDYEIIPHYIFTNWLYLSQGVRQHPIEIFTTNYDLFFEKALENKKIPFFDGFVGAIEPFLVPECIDAENIKSDLGHYIPYSWIRLWKLHGSVNWYLTKDSKNINKVIRTFKKNLDIHDELMIYPSKQKYDDSRRLPFIVFQDRLRKFLSSGETLLVICGYSFGDDHINEILFQTLRANKRLAIVALVFGDVAGKTRSVSTRILEYGYDYPNLSIIGPDKACIGGVIGNWNSTDSGLDNTGIWDKDKNICDIGNFVTFTSFLRQKFAVDDPVVDVKKVMDEEQR